MRKLFILATIITMSFTAQANAFWWGKDRQKETITESAQILPNGLHTQSWLRSVKEDDVILAIMEARKQNKILFIRIEQPSCYYCKLEHNKVFTDKRLKPLLDKHVYGIQIMINGQFPMIDLDGDKSFERNLTNKWDVKFTPATFVILPSNNRVTSGRPLHQVADLLIPGAIEVEDYLKLMNELIRDK